MTDDYVTLFLNTAFAANRPEAFLSLLLLFLARMLPIIALSPFFGARVLPHPVKVSFAISLFIVFLPQLLVVTTTPLDFNLLFLLYGFKEMFIGFALGFIMSMPFIIVQNVGMIIDHQRGGASLMINDPTIQNQSSPIGTLFNMMLIYIFFLIDGPFLFIEAIVNSYELVPPDRFLSAQFFIRESPFWQTQIALFNKVMVISVQMAAPALIAILMTDFFLGIVNRLAPQVQVTFLGLPLKSLLALVVMSLGLKLFVKELVNQSHSWLLLIKEAIHSFI